MVNRLMIIEPSAVLCAQLTDLAGLIPGLQIVAVQNELAALNALAIELAEVILLDLDIADEQNCTLQHKLLEIAPESETLLLAKPENLNEALVCLRQGARDLIIKPFHPEHLRICLERALEDVQIKAENVRLKSIISDDTELFEDFVIGNTPRMKEVMDTVERAAHSTASIYIEGETGTGKELIAKQIHFRSARRSGPFVAINCGAIPDTLFESELFGYEKGAFTGALERKAGKFELADGGTLFLDELTSLPLAMQAKLLRVLQEDQIERIGGLKPIDIDARIISASNSNIKEEIAAGQFREDLFHRLNVVPIYLPPLRERIGDLVLFIKYFLNKYNHVYNQNIHSFPPDILDALRQYSFPGNLRELENMVERAVCLGKPSAVFSDQRNFIKDDNMNEDVSQETLSLIETVENIEREMIYKALRRTCSNVSKAAILLKIPRKTLCYRIEKLKVSVE